MKPKLKKNIKKPKHNKLRLVYDIARSGQIDSYFYVEHAEAKRIIQIVKYLRDKTEDIYIQKMCKDLKIHRITLTRTIRVLAGVKRIDMKSGDKYIKLTGKILQLRKTMYNKKRNIVGVPPYMRAPIKVRRAST